jgi:preprotein translocase subunit SecE
MSKLKLYFEEIYQEMVNKVSWPSWRELQSSALVVMSASIIIALIIYAMDLSFSTIMEKFYGI